MPRNGEGMWSDIPNITAVPGQVIESADWNNYRADLRDNEFNAARPITAGGTGATNAVDALDNLGGVGQSNFLSAYSIGDFYETVRNIAAVDGVWLRRNGALYDKADYPELGDLMPSLPDGVEWSNISGVSGELVAIVITSSAFFVASKAGDDTNIWRSTDGVSFALVGTVPDLSAISFSYLGGIFILSGIDNVASGKIATSTDGTTWSALISPGVGNTVFDVAFNGSLYIAVGNGGQIASSPDLSAWTLRTIGTTNSLRSANYLNGKFVITGVGGVVVTSADGISYTVQASGTAQNLFNSTYSTANSLYVIVGNNGTIITSPNLTAWTPRTSGTTQTLNDVVSSASGLMAVGSSGTARISSTGTSWTATTTGVSANLLRVAFDPDAQQEYYALGAGSFVKGIRTLPTQFRVPNDDATYGWIKAEEA